MGQKTHPLGIRLGFHRKWSTSWTSALSSHLPGVTSSFPAARFAPSPEILSPGGRPLGSREAFLLKTLSRLPRRRRPSFAHLTRRRRSPTPSQLNPASQRRRHLRRRALRRRSYDQAFFTPSRLSSKLRRRLHTLQIRIRLNPSSRRRRSSPDRLSSPRDSSPLASVFPFTRPRRNSPISRFASSRRSSRLPTPYDLQLLPDSPARPLLPSQVSLPILPFSPVLARLGRLLPRALHSRPLLRFASHASPARFSSLKALSSNISSKPLKSSPKSFHIPSRASPFSSFSSAEALLPLAFRRPSFPLLRAPRPALPPKSLPTSPSSAYPSVLATSASFLLPASTPERTPVSLALPGSKPRRVSRSDVPARTGRHPATLLPIDLQLHTSLAGSIYLFFYYTKRLRRRSRRLRRGRRSRQPQSSLLEVFLVTRPFSFSFLVLMVISPFSVAAFSTYSRPSVPPRPATTTSSTVTFSKTTPNSSAKVLSFKAPTFSFPLAQLEALRTLDSRAPLRPLVLRAYQRALRPLHPRTPLTLNRLPLLTSSPVATPLSSFRTQTPHTPLSSPIASCFPRSFASSLVARFPRSSAFSSSPKHSPLPSSFSWSVPSFLPSTPQHHFVHHELHSHAFSPLERLHRPSSLRSPLRFEALLTSRFLTFLFPSVPSIFFGSF